MSVPLPDFITSASLELRELASFLLFLTAILSLDCWFLEVAVGDVLWVAKRNHDKKFAALVLGRILHLHRISKATVEQRASHYWPITHSPAEAVKP